MNDLDKLTSIERIIPNIMVVTWVINNICDRACTYCPDKLHNGSNHHYDWNNAKIFWQMLIDRYPNIHVSIAGGEPSLSPHLKEAIDMIWDSGNTVGITTNLSRTLRYFLEIAPKLSYLSISYHPSSPDKNFFEKVSELQHITPCTVRVMMDSRHWDHSVEVYTQLQKLERIFVEPVRILDWENGRNPHVYTEEQEQWFLNSYTIYPTADQPVTRPSKDFRVRFNYEDGSVANPGDANSLISYNQNRFRGWRCHLGLESLFIHQTGAIRKANCDQSIVIGNINRPRERIVWPTAPEICDIEVCHCTTDVMITKYAK